jgi:hypothetical protein
MCSSALIVSAEFIDEYAQVAWGDRVFGTHRVVVCRPTATSAIGEGGTSKRKGAPVRVVPDRRTLSLIAGSAVAGGGSLLGVDAGNLVR